jgi:hypothetical protein
VARVTALASIKATVDNHAANVLPIIGEAKRAGATTLRQIAAVLNARGVSTARRGTWGLSSVSNILDRSVAGLLTDSRPQSFVLTSGSPLERSTLS